MEQHTATNIIHSTTLLCSNSPDNTALYLLIQFVPNGEPACLRYKKTKVNPAEGNNFHLLHHPNKTQNSTVQVKVEFLNAGHGGTKSNHWASDC